MVSITPTFLGVRSVIIPSLSFAVLFDSNMVGYGTTPTSSVISRVLVPGSKIFLLKLSGVKCAEQMTECLNAVH